MAAAELNGWSRFDLTCAGKGAAKNGRGCSNAIETEPVETRELS
jgi:hypothetical protein